MTHEKAHQTIVVHPHSHVHAEPVVPVKKKHNYVRVKDKPDPRDHKFHLAAPIELPDDLSLVAGCSPIRDQGEEGACTGFAITGAMMYVAKAQGEVFVQLSEQFVYFNEREMEGDINQDGGAQIRDGIKLIAQYGACEEQYCPYGSTTFATKPQDTAYANGLLHKGLVYQAVNQTEADICAALVSGFPIVFGVSVYDSFESDEAMATGVIPMPNTQTEQCLGGHAILLVGYDKTKQLFTFRNSWGTDVGLPDQRGYFTLPFAYVLDPDLASDFWVISKIT